MSIVVACDLALLGEPRKGCRMVEEVEILQHPDNAWIGRYERGRTLHFCSGECEIAWVEKQQKAQAVQEEVLAPA